MKPTDPRIELLQVVILLLAGILTLIMQQFVPIAGGGDSLIYVLSVPIEIGLSIIFSFIQYRLWQKQKNRTVRTVLFFIFTIILILLSIQLYPYK